MDKYEKKILFILFSEVIGGAEAVFIKLVEKIDKKVFDVHILISDEIKENIDIKDIKVHSIGLYFKSNLIDLIKRFLFSIYRKTIGYKAFKNYL